MFKTILDKLKLFRAILDAKRTQRLYNKVDESFRKDIKKIRRYYYYEYINKLLNKGSKNDKK